MFNDGERGVMFLNPTNLQNLPGMGGGWWVGCGATDPPMYSIFPKVSKNI